MSRTSMGRRAAARDPRTGGKTSSTTRLRQGNNVHRRRLVDRDGIRQRHFVEFTKIMNDLTLVEALTKMTGCAAARETSFFQRFNVRPRAGTIEGNTFTTNNEGMVFGYRK
jgi:hypothetical protein